MLASENDSIGFPFSQRRQKKRGFEGEPGLVRGNCGHPRIYTNNFIVSNRSSPKSMHQQVTPQLMISLSKEVVFISRVFGDTARWPDGIHQL